MIGPNKKKQGGVLSIVIGDTPTRYKDQNGHDDQYMRMCKMYTMQFYRYAKMGDFEKASMALKDLHDVFHMNDDMSHDSDDHEMMEGGGMTNSY